MTQENQGTVARGPSEAGAGPKDTDEMLFAVEPSSEAGVLDGTFVPRLELCETSSSYVLRAELPGMSARDIELAIHGHELTLRGERALRRGESEESMRFSECAYGAFERTVRLPPGANMESVEADFIAGILEVRIAKTRR